MKAPQFGTARSSEFAARRARMLLGRMSALLAGCAILAPSASNAATPADLVVTGARIYTADARHSIAEAMAIRNGQVIYVGDISHARALAGPATQFVDAGGKLVLPGLVDSHIHPTG